MLKPGKLATPFVAATVVVPLSAPPPGFVPIATVTFAAKVGSVFPRSSWAATCGAGVIGDPATVLVGWIVRTRWVAAPAVIVNGLLVALARVPPAATRGSPVPARL